eukprot:285469_1
MGNVYSKTIPMIYVFGVETTISAVVYHFIFWKLFAFFEIRKKTPKLCLTLSTNSISTMNAILLTFPSFVDFFYYQRWKYPTIDEPKLAGHIWAIGLGYFIADLTAHLICYNIYNKSTIPRRLDIIIHHILPILVWFMVQVPKPIYMW